MAIMWVILVTIAQTAAAPSCKWQSTTPAITTRLKTTLPVNIYPIALIKVINTHIQINQL
jgi:hypothetical protein